VVILNASSPSEIESAFATLVGERAGALVVSGETFFLTQRAEFDPTRTSDVPSPKRGIGRPAHCSGMLG